jgi:hypothetical protein
MLSTSSIYTKPMNLKSWFADRMGDDGYIVHVVSGLTFRKWVLNKAFSKSLKPSASEKEIIDSSFRYMEYVRPYDYAKIKKRHGEYKVSHIAQL